MEVFLINSAFCFIVFCVFVFWGATRRSDGKGAGWQKGIAIFFGLMTMFGVSGACSAGGYDFGALLIFILGWFVILIVNPIINSLASSMNSDLQAKKSDGGFQKQEVIAFNKREVAPTVARYNGSNPDPNRIPVRVIEENNSRRINDSDVALHPQANVSRIARSNNNAIVYFCFVIIIGLLAWAIYSHYHFRERIDDVAYDVWQVKRDLDDKSNESIRYTDKEVSKVSDDCKERCSGLEDAIGWVKSDQRRIESSMEDREESPIARKPLLGGGYSPQQTNNVYSSPLPPLSPDDDINVELEECNKAEIAMISSLMSTFLYANEKGDESIFRKIYADTVSYCYKKDSKASKEYIINELRELWRKWPVRSYKVIDAEFKKRRTDKYYITANVTFHYKNGSRSISGDVEYFIFFEYIPKAGFRMTSFDETVKMHKRK